MIHSAYIGEGGLAPQNGKYWIHIWRTKMILIYWMFITLYLIKSV